MISKYKSHKRTEIPTPTASCTAGSASGGDSSKESWDFAVYFIKMYKNSNSKIFKNEIEIYIHSIRNI